LAWIGINHARSFGALISGDFADSANSARVS
jgi:hypothetical protein